MLEGLRQFVPEPERGSTFLVHGTTVGLNAFLERKGTRLLLIMTEGLRDAYSIARHDRKELYALRYRKPERLVPRRDVVEVVERLRWDGSVETPLLDRASLEPLFARIRERGRRGGRGLPAPLLRQPRARAPGARTCCGREFPELSITLSHEIAREWREYERASSAVLNAYIAPRVERYLATLERELGELEVSSPLHVMQSNGGITSAAKRAPRADPDAALGPGRRARSAARRSPARPADATCSASTWAAPRSTSASSSTASRQSRPRPSSRACPC